MFARFDENPAMTLQDIKKTKRYGGMRTDNVKTVYPPQTKFAGGIKNTIYNFLGEILTSDPSIYMMDHPDLTVSNLMENSIGLKMDNILAALCP